MERPKEAGAPFVCPRCGREAIWRLGRSRASSDPICTECENAEAMIDLAGRELVGPEGWPLRRRGPREV